MVDDWLFGSIRHGISGLFSPDGQGLLQYDKDRSEGEYNSIGSVGHRSKLLISKLLVNPDKRSRSHL
jgi:hypothetical protein